MSVAAGRRVESAVVLRGAVGPGRVHERGGDGLRPQAVRDTPVVDDDGKRNVGRVARVGRGLGEEVEVEKEGRSSWAVGHGVL